MPTNPSIARIWRGRTRRDIADSYEQYLRAEGIPPLEKTALGVQLLTEADEEHMRKVVGYVHRHAAQRPTGDVSGTPWRFSLMNWGHDPLKK